MTLDNLEPRPRFAPEGKTWICCACGKQSRDQFGDAGTLWDASCMLNSVLVEVKDIHYVNGQIHIGPVEIEKANG